MYSKALILLSGLFDSVVLPARGYVPCQRRQRRQVIAYTTPRPLSSLEDYQAWPRKILQRQIQWYTVRPSLLGNAAGLAVRRTRMMFFRAFNRPGSQNPKRFRFLGEPTSPFRLQLDVSSVIVLLFELSVEPCVLAWAIPFGGFLKVCTYITTVV